MAALRRKGKWGVELKYHLFDHTADIGVRIFGKSLENLFEHAAEALFSLIVQGGSSEKNDVTTLCVTGETLEHLFMNWMRALLMQFSIKERIVLRVRIVALSENALEAELHTSSFDPDCHEIQHEIKAVTYHGLVVEKRGNGWFAQVVLDV